MNSAQESDRRKVEVCFDTGATDTVMHLRMCDHISVKPSPQSELGTEYEVANGETIPNVGERRRVVMTEGSEIPKLMNFQVCYVHKPLLSETKVCDMNYKLVLERNGGHLVDQETGDVIPLHRRGSLYIMYIWVRGSSFPRQG